MKMFQILLESYQKYAFIIKNSIILTRVLWKKTICNHIWIDCVSIKHDKEMYTFGAKQIVRQWLWQEWHLTETHEEKRNYWD